MKYLTDEEARALKGQVINATLRNMVVEYDESRRFYDDQPPVYERIIINESFNDFFERKKGKLYPGFYLLCVADDVAYVERDTEEGGKVIYRVTKEEPIRRPKGYEDLIIRII